MDRLRGILFGSIILVISIPLIQDSFRIVESGKLNGDFQSAPDALFSIKDWWGGVYQEQKTRYLNDNFGLHNDLVRLNNQLHFSFFRKIHANDMVSAIAPTTFAINIFFESPITNL